MVGLRCGGGEFGDYKDNATLYKYYIVEVVNPYYCSSLDEITADPGQTVDVSLSSLVRTWKLDVTVNDYSKGEPLYNLANVYVARPSKGTIPFTVPRSLPRFSASRTSANGRQARLTPSTTNSAAFARMAGSSTSKFSARAQSSMASLLSSVQRWILPTANKAKYAWPPISQSPGC